MCCRGSSPLTAARASHTAKILGCTGLTIDRFTRYLPYSCRMIHDAEAAATAELWNTDIQNAIFFHIRNNLSGALIVDGCFLKGNELKSGVFEHMTIVTGGRPCYCGKCGCMETYCSMRALLSEDPDRDPPPTPEEADRFFCALRAGNAVAAARWDRYLHDLALAIDNLHADRLRCHFRRASRRLSAAGRSRRPASSGCGADGISDRPAVHQTRPLRYQSKRNRRCAAVYPGISRDGFLAGPPQHACRKPNFAATFSIHARFQIQKVPPHVRNRFWSSCSVLQRGFFYASPETSMESPFFKIVVFTALRSPHSSPIGKEDTVGI